MHADTKAQRLRTGSRALLRRLSSSVRSYFSREPSFEAALGPALLVSAALFVRSPASNFVFDEQEALLANPYVNGQTPFWEAFRRDFWGLPPDRSIGSYRPLPNVLWRILWQIRDVSWLPHWLNVVVHAVNGALVASFAFWVTRTRAAAWFAGAIFVTMATLTEAVSGVVGTADVLGALGLLCALAALRLSALRMTPLVFLAILFGLFSKESAMVATVLVPLAAFTSAPQLHPQTPRPVVRAGLSALATLGAFILYTEARRRLFPTDAGAATPTGSTASVYGRALDAFLAWFKQPRLPRDPLNNPLVDADFPHRIAGALRVYWRGLSQALFPRSLSGDYSFAQEPVPAALFFPESILGALAFVLPLACGGILFVGLMLSTGSKAHGLRALLALGLLWWPLAYLPHSNALVLLPTVRAERFWYLPALGLAWTGGVTLQSWLSARNTIVRRLFHAGVLLYFTLQTLQARRHALDYTDDLVFWRSTKRSSPLSAKAHLNYSVMVGARGNLEERLSANARALEIAPEWPMANVYYGDTLCRLHRAEESFRHFRRGFELGPNESHLIALGLQCLWEEGAVPSRQDELIDLADRHPGTWLSYLARDIVENGRQHGGVEAKYRPRAYNAGPKE